jgi:hypothetical protein
MFAASARRVAAAAAASSSSGRASQLASALNHQVSVATEETRGSPYLFDFTLSFAPRW